MLRPSASSHLADGWSCCHQVLRLPGEVLGAQGLHRAAAGRVEGRAERDRAEPAGRHPGMLAPPKQTCTALRSPNTTWLRRQVVRNMVFESRLLPGGGATEMAIGQALVRLRPTAPRHARTAMLGADVTSASCPTCSLTAQGVVEHRGCAAVALPRRRRGPGGHPSHAGTELRRQCGPRPHAAPGTSTLRHQCLRIRTRCPVLTR